MSPVLLWSTVREDETILGTRRSGPEARKDNGLGSCDIPDRHYLALMGEVAFVVDATRLRPHLSRFLATKSSDSPSDGRFWPTKSPLLSG